MSAGTSQSVLLWTFCLLFQLTFLTAFGELLARSLCGWRPARDGVPEFSFCLGLAGYLLTGCAVLPFALSAKSIPVAIALAAAGLWIYRSTTLTPLPEPLLSYARFRQSRGFYICLALLVLFLGAVSSARINWLLERTTQNGIGIGTWIWDDVRTIGFPLALAADGYPMRSPIAMEMFLPYATGPFTYTAGWIAWFPRLALPVLLSDVVAQSLFYCLAVLFVACTLIPQVPARVLLFATAVIGSSYNLWDLGIRPEWRWVSYFFGYFKLNKLYTTIAWTPLTGVAWIPNHVLGFSALLLAALCFLHFRQRKLALLFALFAASASLDMTAMGLAAMAALTAIPVLRQLTQRIKPAAWVWPAVGICACTAVAVVLINLPSLTGRVDSPYDPVFPIIGVPRFNVGMFGSHNGLYLILLAAALLFWRNHAALRTAWMVPLLTGIAFSFAFEYHSIWFWRFSFAAHCLFGLAIAMLYPARRSRLYIALWIAILIPGLLQLRTHIVMGLNAGPFVSAEKASAIHWIYDNTPISARVVEFNPAEADLVHDLAFLRTANRAGTHPYDRSHALIGYQAYMLKFSYLHAGVAANDYVLTPRSDRDFLTLFSSCGAERAFETQTLVLFHVTDPCRRQLTAKDKANEYSSWSTRLALRASFTRNHPPEKMTTPVLREYVILNPEAMWILRQRLDSLWSQVNPEELVQLLQPVAQAHPQLAEARYSYGYALLLAHRNAEAIGEFTAALDNGYAKFWALYGRGSAYLGLGQRNKARADLERAAQLDPKHANVRALLDRVRTGALR